MNRMLETRRDAMVCMFISLLFNDARGVRVNNRLWMTVRCEMRRAHANNKKKRLSQHEGKPEQAPKGTGRRRAKKK